MQSIVSLMICIVDFDATLSQDSHDFTVTILGRYPESVQAFLVLLVDVNHFIFEHEAHKFFATIEGNGD